MTRRDSYGFPVPDQFADLFSQFSPVWAEEEAERTKKWDAWMSAYTIEHLQTINTASNTSGNYKEEAEWSLSSATNNSVDSTRLMQHAIAQYTRSERSTSSNNSSNSTTSAGTSVCDALPSQIALLRQLKALVQLGLPMRHRSKFWAVFLGIYEKKKQNTGDEYKVLVQKAEELEKQGDGTTGDGDFHVFTVSPIPSSSSSDVDEADVTTKTTDAMHDQLQQQIQEDWLLQIDKDLHRTFPSHPLLDDTGCATLRRILAAYSIRNPHVGYCQGLNFLAASFMLFFSEEEAFLCLCVVVEDLLPGYFDPLMVAPQVDGLVFTHLLRGTLPRVAQHLEKKLQVDISSATSAWFLLSFLTFLPFESCLRVWDILFFEHSSVVLFRVALALIDIYSQPLLDTDDSSEAYLLLQSLAPMTFDASRLVDSACIGFGYVKDAALRVLRDKYRPQVMTAMEGMFSCEEDMLLCFETASSVSSASLSRSQSFAEAWHVAVDGAHSQGHQREEGNRDEEESRSGVSRSGNRYRHSTNTVESIEEEPEQDVLPPAHEPSPSTFPKAHESSLSPTQNKTLPASPSQSPGCSPSRPQCHHHHQSNNNNNNSQQRDKQLLSPALTPSYPFRRTQSAASLGALTRRVSAVHQHHYQQQRLNLHLLSAYVPDLNHPKIQSVYRIATTKPLSKANRQLMSIDSPFFLKLSPSAVSLAKQFRKEGDEDSPSTIDIGSITSMTKHSMLLNGMRIVPRRFTDGGAVLLLQKREKQGPNGDSVGLGSDTDAETPLSPGTEEEKVVKLQSMCDALQAEVDEARRRHQEAVAAANEASTTAQALHRQLTQIQSEIDSKMENLRELFARIAAAEAEKERLEEEARETSHKAQAVETQFHGLKDKFQVQATLVSALMTAIQQTTSAKASPPRSPTKR